MSELDYDDPDVVEHWCLARRTEVETYLQRQQLAHGALGEWPAWHAAPHVSLWAVESAGRPGAPGWWVVCGDIPSDYMSAEAIRHPRAALRAIGERWTRMARGEAPGEGHVSKELVPLLETRAALLLVWAGDDAAWGPQGG